MTEVLTFLHTASAWAAVLSALLLGGALAYNLKTPAFGFWPAASGWRHATAFGIFRLFCGATVVFALAEIWAHGLGHWLRYALGVPVTVVAFGITLWGYRFLGLDNTYCEADGLVTGGMYAYSRNPQYVTSVLATVGLGIVAASPLTLVFAVVLFVLYFLFILNEERWLAEGYGRAFLEYMATTPRFIDERSFMRLRADVLAKG
ncbi:methyltransferase family protein [Marinibacterium profundimaris]|uniref:Heavy metal resistance protein CzcN n=1 Tax=Marinibacterium profundimaris TaxID=1679460 RepID=A0A225NXC7_9RHOB|nr:PEMT/PEM2 methyltransferase family protein [Marinibacterium profundimaris]OWU77957.1 heavy metal resistance protein CzcN [Marinibacterium profundimaris]